MMDHAQFRRALMADPRDPDPELRVHRESCHDCNAFAERLMRFESRLERAMRVDLPEDEIEMGIGIHGEPGRTRMKLQSADKVTELLMDPILTDIPFNSGDEVLLFVNGMGGTPQLELYVIYRKALEIAKAHGLKVSRNLVGSYITSLEMAGASISILKLDESLRKFWDAPVKTPALRWGV